MKDEEQSELQSVMDDFQRSMHELRERTERSMKYSDQLIRESKERINESERLIKRVSQMLDPGR